MSTPVSLSFDGERLLNTLVQTTDIELDALEFGVIGFDAEGVVRTYNTCESNSAGLSVDRIKGQSMLRQSLSGLSLRVGRPNAKFAPATPLNRFLL